MKIHPKSSVYGVILLLGAVMPMVTSAQELPIPQGCNATPAQLEAEKKIAAEFYRHDITLPELIALIDPSYVQHNPLAVKAAAENHLSDYGEFKRLFTKMTAMAGTAGPYGPAKPGNVVPEPVIIMAECDLVTVVIKGTLLDPTAAPGTKYEAFSWDTFRIKNGKIVEHWDGTKISAGSMKALRSLESATNPPPKSGPALPEQAMPSKLK